MTGRGLAAGRFHTTAALARLAGLASALTSSSVVPVEAGTGTEANSTESVEVREESIRG